MNIDPLVGASLINAAANIGSGFFGGGGSEGLSRDDQRFLADFQWKQSLRNESFQQEMARNGISIRAADAERAGLHPLAALGISPSSGGGFGTAFGGSPASRGPSPFADSLRSMGQDVSRAAAAVSSREQRMAMALDLENKQLNNDYMREMIENASWERMRQVGPPFPTPPKPQNAFKSVRNADGSISKIPTDEASMAIGNNFWRNLDWNISNKLMPFGDRDRKSMQIQPRRSNAPWRYGR